MSFLAHKKGLAARFTFEPSESDCGFAQNHEARQVRSLGVAADALPDDAALVVPAADHHLVGRDRRVRRVRQSDVRVVARLQTRRRDTR